jgi:hypothetical protein
MKIEMRMRKTPLAKPDRVSTRPYLQGAEYRGGRLAADLYTSQSAFERKRTNP